MIYLMIFGMNSHFQSIGQYLCLFLVALIGSCGVNQSSEPAIWTNETFVTDFKLGLVCPDPNGIKSGEQTRGIGSGSICKSSDEFIITGEQTCIYNGDPIDCTWFGYEFDYIGLEDAMINCTYKTNIPVDSGNPNEVLATNTTVSEIEFRLDSESGHFYNPLYALKNYNATTETRVKTEVTCNHKNEQLFSIRYVVVHLADDLSQMKTEKN